MFRENLDTRFLPLAIPDTTQITFLLRLIEKSITKQFSFQSSGTVMEILFVFFLGLKTLSRFFFHVFRENAINSEWKGKENN